MYPGTVKDLKLFAKCSLKWHGGDVHMCLYIIRRCKLYRVTGSVDASVALRKVGPTS